MATRRPVELRSGGRYGFTVPVEWQTIVLQPPPPVVDVRQMPKKHSSLKLHRFPHDPQLFSSVSVSLHDPLQHVLPSAQQAPLQQVSPKSQHVPPQHSLNELHVVPSVAFV